MKLTESQLRNMIRKEIINEVQGMAPPSPKTPKQKAMEYLSMAKNEKIPEHIQDQIALIISDLGKIK